MEDRKRSSSVPPACPFWSDGVQTDHALEHMRPLDLDGRHQPVPHDDEPENSPKPLREMPSGLQSVGQFESPASERGRPAEPSGVEKHVEAAARRSERAWRRRGHAADRSVRADLGTDGKVEMNGKELEKELGDQVLQHFQHETARLQQQNDEFQRELQKMREERDRHVALAIPPSWVPKSPPRMTPSMESHGAWVSPVSFHCTPNGTRVPPGPPPPDPPALPVWPPDISSVEPSVEPPRKIRGVMGGNGNRSSDVCSPRAARNLWLEREVAALQEKLDQETLKNKQLSGYWSIPFLTESAREKELAESVACMKRQAGMTDRWMSSEAARHHGIFHGDRAGTEHALGDLYQPDRASLQHVHGDVFHGDRACMQNVHGGVFLGDRASMQHVHGSVSHGGPIPRQLFVFQGFLIQLLLQCCYFSFKPKIPSRSW